MIKIYKKIKPNWIRWRRKDNNLLHREDGPAVEWNDGTKCWYQNGELHRKDGPAIEYLDEIKKYYLNNKYYPDIKNDEEWIIFQIIN